MSEEALHCKVILVSLFDETFKSVGSVGGETSVVRGVLMVRVLAATDRFPAASLAFTVKLYDVLGRSPVTSY
ncbi:hypothetical protein D3C81_2195120 [compost metagenome]